MFIECFTYMSILMEMSERGWRGDVKVRAHKRPTIGIDLEQIYKMQQSQKGGVLMNVR